MVLSTLPYLRRIIATTSIICSIPLLQAQETYPYPEQEESAALNMDDIVFVAWATSCLLERGPGLIHYPDSIKVTNGEASFATGKPGNEVVSLGDGGRATLFFKNPLMDGPGPDFAVFENSFDGNFLELGFVEVSSDNKHFVRFPSLSLTPVDVQIGPFGTLDPENIHNLAGKYSSGWGTPFDLKVLKDSSSIDISNITAVRIIDVIGILDETLGSKDSEGRLVNDPFPTPFETGGFDLDAVGVIHESVPAEINTALFGDYSSHSTGSPIKLFPNPCREELNIKVPANSPGKWMLMDIKGRVHLSGNINTSVHRINTNHLPDGIYVLHYKAGTTHEVQRIIKNSR